MCAAKLEKTGFVLRHVWPNVKHFANEQSSTLAQSANESSFVRKNSKKAEAAASGATSTGRCSRPLTRPAVAGVSAFVQRRQPQPRWRLDARQTQTSRHFAVAAAAVQAAADARPAPQTGLRLPSAPQVPAPARDGRMGRNVVSIDDLIMTASAKYDLNKDFWGKYTDIPSMAKATDKEDILQIIDNFVLIHRKHIYLFQRLKNTVLRNLDTWSAPDLAMLCHAWAQLGFLHEDLCIAMADRVVATAQNCTTQELCWLMDAYATARCCVQSVNLEIMKQTLLKIDDFALSELCLHASSFARLNLQCRGVFDAIGQRLAGMPFADCSSMEGHALSIHGQEKLLSARDVTLAAYSFSKLGFYSPPIFKAISRRSLEVIRDFTARDLQMLIVAFAKARHVDSELLDSISVQAQRRIAQFNSESLVLMLRSMAFFSIKDDSLFTRVLVQLPRAILTFRPSDAIAMLNAYAAVQVYSVALIDLVTPFLLEKAPALTPSDWLSALRGYSAMGCKDATFLSAMSVHLEASKLSWSQLCSAIIDCSRLSFAGASASLAEVALVRLVKDRVVCPVDAIAEMYSALLLLGHSTSDSEDGKEAGLLMELADRLRSCSDLLGALPYKTCASLCYSVMLAPPVTSGRVEYGEHPVDALFLAGHFAVPGRSWLLSTEDRLMLQQVRRTLHLLPWNRRALKSEQDLGELTEAETADEAMSPPEPFYLAALGHLVPHHNEAKWCSPPLSGSSCRAAISGTRIAPAASNVSSTESAENRDSDQRSRCGSSDSSSELGERLGLDRCRGTFAANEIQEGLREIMAALSACDIEHHLITEVETEVHVSIPRQALSRCMQQPEPNITQNDIAVVWGSKLHYVSNGVSQLDLSLSPAARFQVTALKASRALDVVVVPYWWWPRHGNLKERGAALARFLSDGAE